VWDMHVLDSGSRLAAWVPWQPNSQSRRWTLNRKGHIASSTERARPRPAEQLACRSLDAFLASARAWASVTWEACEGE